MQQNAKFIDLRRTYLPVNANTFPTSMHGTSQEDSPENRIPVMAYEAKNILPTAQGYKSYFGTDQTLNIDALTERADYVFIYQNLAFENILIALTESGIWVKKANAVGAWTNPVPIVPPFTAGTHYDWTYVVISNDLYVYRQNYGSYQKIVSDVTLGVAITSVVPNTLNMSGQMGIFRAGGRLGFWDSDDSVSWSNQDDYADFEPSIVTFAGSTKFLDVNGRIVTIKGHGPGYIIYCTKSIIYVQANTEATFQWSPKPIFSTNGITYPRQCVAGSPDTTHFAYTSEGLYKIEDAREEALVTEVTDVLATHNGPVYLFMSEGRYLYLEILDPDYLDSLTQFTQGTTGDDQYYFPGSNVNLADAIEEELLTGTNICNTIAGMDDGIYADLPADPGDKKAGTNYRPTWVAYLSNQGVIDSSGLGWTNVPVATIDPNGVEANQCPNNAPLGQTSTLGTGPTGKTVLAGSDAYIDGIWTMERFVQAQEAIWQLQEDSLSAFFTKVLARQKSVNKEYYSPTDAPVPYSVDKQLIGIWSSTFTKGQFGFSKCEFWLTRWCVGAKKIYRIKKNIVTSVDDRVIQAPDGYSNNVNLGGGNTAYNMFPTMEAALTAGGGTGAITSGGALAAYGTDYYGLTGVDGIPAKFKQAGQQVIGGGGTAVAWAVYKQPSGRTTYLNSSPAYYGLPHDCYNENPGGRYKINELMIATNSDEDVEIGPIPDTGYCTLAGWAYTKTDNSTGSIPVSACSADAAYPPGSPIRATPPGNGMGIGDDGSFCSIPFEPVTIDPVPGVILEWPSTSVLLPVGNFLLQDGSIAPIYPTMYGALVYDLKLKKWGNYNGTYKVLLNYSPINNSDSGVIPYSIFGILGGILATDGTIRLFTDSPADSYITYGKIGFYRLGITSCEEVHVNFDRPSTGYLRIDTSVEGRFVDPGLAVGTSFTDASKVKHTGSYPGSWNNVTISGNFQISYLEYRGRTNGKR